MNPEGSLLPGVISFAISATNDDEVQIMPTALSYSSGKMPNEVSARVVVLDVSRMREFRFRREPPLRRVLIDCIREFAAKSREQLLFFKPVCFDSVSSTSGPIACSS